MVGFQIVSAPIMIVLPSMEPRRFRLKTPTIAVAVTSDRTVIEVPAGDEIVVIDNLEVDPAKPNCQVNVKWKDRTVKMFAGDVLDRGVPV